ncbi:MAG: DUF4407 domain-containing protein [Winogradskyella sp.]|uniref:DUF4407 domain-containing protein n=1 Tax=Winogradskyella sp. TaxID=1883156 RepID=UPI00385C0B45
MRKLNFIQIGLLRLAGFDKTNLEQCTKSEINEKLVIASLILVPVGAAIISYTWGIYFVTQNLTYSIFGGVFASGIVLLIDRSIIALGRPGKLSIGLFGRFLLAVTMGFLIAEPMVIGIFGDSIKEQQASELFDKQEEIVQYYDEKIYAIKDDIEDQRSELFKFQHIYTIELDGSGGSGVRNPGPIYQKKLQDYNEFKADFDIFKNSADNQIRELELSKQSKISNLRNIQATGIIGAYRSLQNLAANEPAVAWTIWLLRVFFILLDLTPFLVKISNSGSFNLYYKVKDLRDREHLKIVERLTNETNSIIVQEEKLRNMKKVGDLNIKEIQTKIENKEAEVKLLVEKLLEKYVKELECRKKGSKVIKDSELIKDYNLDLGNSYKGLSDLLDRLNIEIQS